MMKILMLFLFGCLLFSMNIKGQEAVPLTLFQIEKALLSSKVPLKERNRLLIEGVKKRGITFPFYIGTARNLAALGASEVLLDLLQEKAPPMPTLIQGNMQTEGKPFLINPNDFDIEYRLIPKGEFMMGAKENEAGSSTEEKPQHSVKISKSFYIGQYEITQKQWKAVMGNNPSQNQQCGEGCPVDSVSWDDVQEFIKKLNAKNLDNFNYRLPTEAEWEYAARAMTNTRYYWGDDIDGKLWRIYAHSNDQSATRVGSYLPNAFGLHDMSGNVWEWVEDVWQPGYGKGKNDGSANLEGDSEYRVIKGGSFKQDLDGFRSAVRVEYFKDKKSFHIGFRLAATYKSEK